MFLMHADPLQGRELGPRNWEFFGPVKWHQADGRVPFGVQKTWDFQSKTLAQVMDLPATKIIAYRNV